ncbi:MAG: hypothetical protein K9L79_00500 [Methylobacter tundripaludum]|nr:hypothetical protein [Methylobacter tundripaludum]
MSQQFNDEVEQVAGNDIINKNNIFHIHLPATATENQTDLVSRAVHTLLSICAEANCKAEMYKISQTLFGTSFFKELNLEQLTKLQVIAEALQSKAAKKDESHTAFTQEMDEYDEFLRRTGVRASKLERAALTELMTTCPINPKQIKLAWSNSILIYEDNRLRIKLPSLEPWIGIALALISIGGLYLFILQITLVKLPIQQLLQQVPTILMFLTALILSIRTMIAPAFIGKRIKAAIEKN